MQMWRNQAAALPSEGNDRKIMEVQFLSSALRDVLLVVGKLILDQLTGVQFSYISL